MYVTGGGGAKNEYAESGGWGVIQLCVLIVGT